MSYFLLNDMCAKSSTVSSLGFSKVDQELKHLKSVKQSEQRLVLHLYDFIPNFAGILSIFISDSPLLKISEILNIIYIQGGAKVS